MEHVSKMTFNPLAIVVTVHILPQTHLKSLQYVLAALYNYAKQSHTFLKQRSNLIFRFLIKHGPHNYMKIQSLA